ncbi:MAG: PLxRFG domain-containing protein, partial [Gammaproteobacteria bacterium]|nr:PLxRFG domain-containing protein [Gammaproteobacteria bacterium]MBU2249453.1 PLxRFG domain-containing protein [Gammaproteobacteria bacterium]
EYIKNALNDEKPLPRLEREKTAHQVEHNVHDQAAIKKAYSKATIKATMGPYVNQDGSIDGGKFYNDTGIEIQGGEIRDLNKFIRRLQTMQDLAYNHPEMAQLLSIEMKKRGNTNEMSIEDRKMLMPYSDRLKNSRLKISKAIFYADRINRNLSNETLQKQFGLNEDERKAYWAVRKALNNKKDMIVKFYVQNLFNKKRAGELLAENPGKDMAEILDAVVKAIHNRNNSYIRKGATAETKAAAQDKLRQVLTGFSFKIQEMQPITGDKGLADWALSMRAYAPHKWKSQWRAYVKDKAGARYMFDLPDMKIRIHPTLEGRTKAAKAQAARVVSQKLGNNVEYISVHEFKNLPVDMFEGVASARMESIFSSAIDRTLEEFPGENKEGEFSGIKDRVSDIIRELRLAKGWGAHLIGRKGVAGYTQDLDEVLSEYFTGFNSWWNKGIAAREFGEAMGNIKADKTPEMWRHATEYISDMLGESNEAAWFKKMAGIWFLAGDVSAATLNMTQNWTHAVALLRRLEPKTDKITAEREIAGAMRDVMREYLESVKIPYLKKGRELYGKPTKWISQDELNAIQKIFRQGLLDPQFFGETTGIHTNKVYQSYTTEMYHLLYKMFTGSEGLNRMSTLLAGYRRAKRAGHADPMQAAADTVNMAHFIYGKATRPEIIRKAGALGNAAFTFMTYPMGNISFLKNRWEDILKAVNPHERKVAMKVLGSNLAYIFAFGGLGALPFAFIAKAILKAFTDPEDDWEKWLYEKTGNIEMLPPSMKMAMARTITRGIPAALGNDMSWRVEGTDILGAPIGYQTAKQIYRKITKHALGPILRGEEWHTIAMAMPDMIANPYKAFVAEGGTGIEGKPPIKYTPGERGWKATGFTPTRESETRAAQDIA